MSGEVEKDHELTVAERDCVMTSSEEDMDDLNAFVSERLQFMSAGFGAGCWRQKYECGGGNQWKFSSC